MRVTGNPGNCDLVINVAVSMTCIFSFVTGFIILKHLLALLIFKQLVTWTEILKENQG